MESTPIQVDAVMSTGLTASATGTGIFYDASTGAVSLLEAGLYLITWRVYAEIENGEPGNILVNLTNADGSEIYATSSAVADAENPSKYVNGFAIVTSDGTTQAVLRNETTPTLVYSLPATGDVNVSIQAVKIG